MTSVIKTDSDYRSALARIDELMIRDPAPGSAEAKELEVLAVLLQDYESNLFPLALPDPIEAILFRMDQEGLTQRDLVSFIGSRSKVSEVLARRRPLSLSMIRALHEGLGIPANALLQRYETVGGAVELIDWEKFPIGEMCKRGWLGECEKDSPGIQARVRSFLAVFGRPDQLVALYRQPLHIRTSREMDRYALLAWTARVVTRATEKRVSGSYQDGAVTLALMRRMAQLSQLESGPKLAEEFLSAYGIPLIIEPHLGRTFLDGAAILKPKQAPIIAMTIRYDRIDSFWFTLMHELSHVALHSNRPEHHFYDDLDATNFDDIENQADQLALEALIPKEEWQRSPASRLRTPEAIRSLAQKIGIHPAIVAGRMRFESRNYGRFGNLVGHGLVRRLFQEFHGGDKDV